MEPRSIQCFEGDGSDPDLQPDVWPDYMPYQDGCVLGKAIIEVEAKMVPEALTKVHPLAFLTVNRRLWYDSNLIQSGLPLYLPRFPRQAPLRVTFGVSCEHNSNKDMARIALEHVRITLWKGCRCRPITEQHLAGKLFYARETYRGFTPA